MAVSGVLAARLAAQMTIEQAARKARVSAPYLLRIERHGRVPFALAQRLTHLYSCRLDLLLVGNNSHMNQGGCEA